ncbi:DUF1176 domain-containing protein [Cronobacter sakazakii]|nr:DUF1176 domain-containing protein [Cronobacter sakazakii]EKY2020109.1 DUF1176 domain-containing protein [Cronobacter sakazakii]
MLFRLLSLFSCSLLLASPLWAAPAQKIFSDWQVTCNNQNFCTARNVGGHQDLVMTLSRSAGAKPDASLRIEAGKPEAAVNKAPPLAPRLLLDGKTLVPAGSKWRDMPRRLMTDDPTTIIDFLDQIKESSVITLKDGPGRLSLDGLKAALLFIDAQQKRVGSETAWIKKGNNPPLSVPPAPAIRGVKITNPTPTPLSHDELNELLDYGTWRMTNSQCSLDPMRREVRISALSDDTALMIISCEAGAYNTVDLAWLVSRQKPFASRMVRLRLPFLPADKEQELELMNTSFDEKTKELTTLSKGRGLGDCGVATRWRFDGQRFRLVRYAEEPSCDNWHGPDAWPTLWVTQ